MSDNTPTNSESLEMIRKDAKRRGKRVTVIGQDVYVHPKSVRIPYNADPDKGIGNRYFVMWVMEW